MDETYPKNGKVLGFGELKKLVPDFVLDEVYHALLLQENSSPVLVEILQKLHHKLVLTPYQPTSESMQLKFKTQQRAAMPASVSLHSLKLWETLNFFAAWQALDELQ